MNTQETLRKGIMMVRTQLLILLLLVVGCSNNSQVSRPYKIAEDAPESDSYYDGQERSYKIATGSTTEGQFQAVSYPGYNSGGSKSTYGQGKTGLARANAVDMSEKGYKVGPGDILAIKVYQLLTLEKEENLRSQVDKTGHIYMPLIEHINVKDQTTEQIKDNLVRILGSRYIKDPKVNVSVATYNSKVVMVLGQVRKPGKVILKSNATTLLDAITQAGGIQGSAAPEVEILRGAYKLADNMETERSNQEKQLIIKTGTQRELIPVSKLYAENGPQVNPVIFPGDVIKIRMATEGYVYLMGEVKRPGSTPYRRPLTILQAVSCAGGITAVAEESECKLIRRQVDGSETELIIDLDKIRDGESENILLAQNDTVLVPVNPVKRFFYGLGQFIRIGTSLTYDAAADMGINSAGTGAPIY